MPENIQVQTYATCDESTFSSILQKYRVVLERLHCTDQQLLAWITQISWPLSDDDAFGDTYPLAFELMPQVGEAISCAGLEVSLYTQSAVPTFEDPPAWVGFNLLFDDSTVMDELHTFYRKQPGKLLWTIMQELAPEFHELGVYLTDSWQENRAWRALAEQVGDPWVFDLGIFPRKLSEQFASVPAGFQGTMVRDDFAFAQANRWEQLPWTAA